MALFSSIQESLGLSSPNPSQGIRRPLNDNQKSSDPNAKVADNNEAANPLDLDLNKMYIPTASNWYTAKPYGFRMTMRNGSQYVMFLPISPSNLNITTSFATNVIPTLYGTVEEHSDVRYYDIVIEGTTGIVPKFVKPSKGGEDSVSYQSLQQFGRARFPINSNIALGGFFSNTIAQVSNILNQANKAVSAVQGLLGGGGQPQPETGVYTDQTGYLAFHNLYRFLLKYKKDAAGVDGDLTPRTAHPLTFFNYKDGNEYDCVIRNFVLRKTAENSMLYFYSISLRCYNLRKSGGKQNVEDLNQRLKDLGLDGVKSSTLLSSIKDISSSAKAIVGSAVNGVNLFGR